MCGASAPKAGQWFIVHPAAAGCFCGGRELTPRGAGGSFALPSHGGRPHGDDDTQEGGEDAADRRDRDPRARGEHARRDRGPRRGGGARVRRAPRRLDRAVDRAAGSDRAGRRRVAAAGEGRHRFCAPPGCAVRTEAAREPARVRDRAPPGARRGAASDPGERRGLLRPQRQVCARRLGDHERDHGAGGGGPSRDRVLPVVPTTGHSSGGAACHGRGRGRRHPHPRRRAGDRDPRLRPFHRQGRRRHRRAGQQVRGRGQAHPVRSRRHRRFRGPERGVRDRR